MSWRPKQLVDGSANIITTIESADAHTPVQKQTLSGRTGPLITLPVQGLFRVKAFTLPQVLLGTRFYLPGTDLPSEFVIDLHGTRRKYAITVADTNNKWLVSSSGKYRITVL
jgi:hypothetical protein